MCVLHDTYNISKNLSHILFNRLFGMWIKSDK